MHARWLEVESGICQCLNGSDIGSAALLVRGILEEADRCNLIQKDIKKLSLKKLKYSVEVEDLFQRLVLWGLPRVKPRSEEEIKAKIPRQKYSKMDPRLFESINKINEYVHPNYGSHVVTIRPTQAHALEVIKQSLAVAYEGILRSIG